ncbi:MAG: hypothetical protein HGB12_14895 [Bacteroidetes bacterium]|nr:hypothetical protein [Bacteroidota bacterium]
MKTDNKITCAYYLHTNGTIIFKPLVVFQIDRHYFESPFVKQFWFIRSDMTKSELQSILIEMKKLGAKTGFEEFEKDIEGL